MDEQTRTELDGIHGQIAMIQVALMVALRHAPTHVRKEAMTAMEHSLKQQQMRPAEKALAQGMIDFFRAIIIDRPASP